MAKVYYEVTYHYDNLENYPLLNTKYFKDIMAKLYMFGRSRCVDVFNNKIDEINRAWNATGKPAAFGDFAEDINPEYSNFINNWLKDDFDKVNTELRREYGCIGMEFYLDEISDIRSRLTLFPNVSIWITLKEV